MQQLPNEAYAYRWLMNGQPVIGCPPKPATARNVFRAYIGQYYQYATYVSRSCND
jgi:hypothetical protein